MKESCQSLFIPEFKIPGNGNYSLVIFVGENQHPIDKITQNCHQFAVVPGLKIFPGKVVVFRFRSIGGQCIFEHIFLAGKLHQVFVQPNRPVAGGGDFIPFEVEKFVGRDVVGQDIGSFSL